MIIRYERNIPLYKKLGIFLEADDDSSDSTTNETISADDNENAGSEESDNSETIDADDNENAGSEEDSDDDNGDDDDNETIDADDNENAGSEEDEGESDSASDDESSDSSVDEGEDEEGDENKEITKDDVRKYQLFLRFQELYETVAYFKEKLTQFVSDDSNFAKTSLGSLTRLNELYDMMKDYMLLKFQSDSYLQNSFFFEKIKAILVIILEALRKDAKKDKKSTEENGVNNKNNAKDKDKKS